MPAYCFKLTHIAQPLPALVAAADPQALGVWAQDCATRVLPCFTAAHPGDARPAEALRTLQAWLETGEFHMAVIRKASLDAHAAARSAGAGSAAQSAARAAGQAVATAHVKTHALAAAQYALQAVFRSSAPDQAAQAVMREQARQVDRLLALSAAQA
jgi:hypothetical protein